MNETAVFKSNEIEVQGQWNTRVAVPIVSDRIKSFHL